ncbi:NAD(P)-dependent oxidoreductase [Chloroflexota bacterium]
MLPKVVFTTLRSVRHQQAALKAAPDTLQVIMLENPDPALLREQLADAEFLISERSGIIDAGLIQSAPDLRLIQRLGSLTHDIDLAAAQAAGVIVCSWPLPDVIRVAEHVMLQILALIKQVKRSEMALLSGNENWPPSQRTDANTFAYNWTQQQNVGTLYGATVGIVGFGEIGAELARRLTGWGCSIFYHKRQPLPEPVECDYGISYAGLDDLLRQSTIVVNLLPYSPQTELLLAGSRLALLPPGALLVSVGSGSVIDETALAQAVRSGQIGGTALDTFEWEPLRPDNPLLALAHAGHNVLLTPHIAAGHMSNGVDERQEFYRNIERYLQVGQSMSAPNNRRSHIVSTVG